MNPENRKRATTTAVALLVAVLGLVISACGNDSSTDPGAEDPDYSVAVAKAPSQLQALYERGGKLVPGGLDAFSEQLADLEGYPVVVNNWASWCVPVPGRVPLLPVPGCEAAR